ncbi:MAG: protein kinase [Rubrobacter sp.]
MGELIDRRYNVVEPLGRGGMAEVYLAHDEVLGRDVALKVLSRRFADDAEFVERFKREARSAATISHPNVVPIYDRGAAENGACYISMEYLPGGTLKDRISRDAPMDAGVVAEVAVQIAEALEAAHEGGVIHRDVKPQNVLVTRTGDVKVCDFGIARAESAGTMTGNVILGTAAYMSPEQAAGQPVDPRSDLYSLGVVMYEMLTGEPPFATNETPAPPKSKNPDVPDATDDLVVRLLSKDPDGRPPSASALADDLRRLLAQGQVPKRPPKAEEASPGQTDATRPTSVYSRSREKKPGPGRSPRRKNLADVVPWLLVVLFIVGVVAGGILVLRVLGAPL